MAAIAYCAVPAQAAKMGAGCSGANLAKTESMIENMADGDSKMAAQKEMSMAQDAMLGGKMMDADALREASGFSGRPKNPQ